MFKYKITLGRVHDNVEVVEGEEHLILHVDNDPQRIVAGLTVVQARLKAINSDTPEEEIRGSATQFAEVIFGKEQSEKLMEFYHNDSGCVITVCSKYFSERLRHLSTKAQKKRK
jgi:hypothetical protein